MFPGTASGHKDLPRSFQARLAEERLDENLSPKLSARGVRGVATRTLVIRFEVRFEDAQKFRVQQGSLSAFLPALWERPISTIFRGNPRNFFFENT
jgi:hypothetical protein